MTYKMLILFLQEVLDIAFFAKQFLWKDTDLTNILKYIFIEDDLDA